MTRDEPAKDGWSAEYLELSRQPLHALVLLGPLAVLYEFWSNQYLRDASTGQTDTVVAHKQIITFFETFGAFGRYLPGAALIAVLVAWHIMKRDPWRVHLGVVAGMVLESVAWALPLTVLGIVAVMAPMAGADLHDLSWQARATIALGAGLYEELVFRMILLAALHMVFVDVARMPEKWGGVLAVVISAVAFAAYHRSVGIDQPALMGFFFLAGVYLAVLFVTRGLAIACLVHVIYDLVALVLLGLLQGAG